MGTSGVLPPACLAQVFQIALIFQPAWLKQNSTPQTQLPDWTPSLFLADQGNMTSNIGLRNDYQPLPVIASAAWRSAFHVSYQL